MPRARYFLAMDGIIGTAREVYSEGIKLSKLLVFSYVVDWVLIL